MYTQEKVLSVGEAAKHLTLASSTLAKLRLSGNGPAYSKLGRRVVYRLYDLDFWINARRFQSTSQYETSGGSSDVK